MPRRGGCFDLDRKEAQIAELERAVSAPEFWKDQANARMRSQELAGLREEAAVWRGLEHEARDLAELIALDVADQTQNFREELEQQYAALEARFRQHEIDTLLSDPYDVRDAIVAVHAGAGGTEAQDWAGMLLRMLLRYCEHRGWRARIVDESRGEEAGIKSVLVEVRGRHAYGLLRSEAGVHRLVRLSPFDADHQRHTSFALVEVLPDLGDAPTVAIDPKDLRIDTFLASGHGGQGVQTTYSAVRVVHLPTGITVSCQNERSQQQNKETAMRVLHARLEQRELERRTAEKQKLRGEFREVAWGNQIRSYVLHPYHLAKDLRTRHETNNPEALLEGELDPFIEAYLRWKAAGGRYERLEGKEEEE
ncbi:peptide chain release factor 2 [Candidatus Uhrbacteria bacterium]|nr:peptide chain release factor 2 [Candidatus Uhrbacteria bacterium]